MQIAHSHRTAPPRAIRPAPRRRALALAVLLAAAATAGCTVERIGSLHDQHKGARQISSQYVQVIGGGVADHHELDTVLVLDVRNTSAQHVYVRVRFTPGAPGRTCESTLPISPGSRQRFLCAQDDVRENVEYPFTVSIFTDVALQRLVEETSSRFLFTDDDIDDMGSI